MEPKSLSRFGPIRRSSGRLEALESLESLEQANPSLMKTGGHEEKFRRNFVTHKRGLLFNSRKMVTE